MTEPAPTTTPEPKPLGMADVRQLAQDYHVPMSDGTMKGLTNENGEVEPEVFKVLTEHIKNQAAGLYPTFAKQIHAGIPTTALLEPYRQVAKQVLGDEYEPDFHGDRHARAALEGGSDGSRPAPMTLSQWSEHLKSEPSFGYMDSEKGQAERKQVLAVIHQAFSGGDNGSA